MNKKSLSCVALFSASLLATSSILAFDWTSSNIQFLHGNGFQFGDKERTTMTVEHAHGWQYGTNFFFVDITNRNDIGIEVYAEVYSYLSFNKISGLNWTLGLLKDISLVGGINISNKPEKDNFKAYIFGLSFDFTNALFNYLQLDVAAFKDDNISGRYGIQITPVWSLPFALGPANFKFRGFTDFRTGNTNSSGNFTILAQPQLLLDIGDLAGWHKDKVYVGAEYSHWYNKFGVQGVDESVLQAMIISFF